jgi:hypothetical protein
MTTLSDAFAAAVPDGNAAAAIDKPRVHARMRAREYRSLSVVRKIGEAGQLAVADLRAAWWTPTSLPTLARAWADRMPDRERVPCGNAVLYRGWVAYNHTVALAVPAVVLAVVGVLTPAVWAARHPARLVLTAVIVTAFTALIFQ